ncbi:UAA transporter family protein [Onchocerca flexuosa]|uniref:UAA transporter family protein n=1 Tax=Onchocerca flexuosa TaxID=387005 RepID=A0A238BRZ5_9BILA|nr:UAA transporter family protein [Onchocerca flexuosa]
MAEIAVGGVLTGCIGCMLTVEVLTKHNPECMNLLTCSTFIFISFISFFKQSDYFKRLPRSRVPLLRGYMRIVLIFFVVNVSNNLALQYDVSIPLFIIFRSGTLLANVLLGYCLRNRICSWGKLSSIVLVSIGIVLFTLADQFSKHPIIEKDGKNTHPLSVLHSSPGIFLLLLAALLSAYLGICQEDLYCKYGNHSQEAIFFIMDLYLECAYTNFVNYIAECGNDHNAKEILIDGSFNYFIQKFFYIYALCSSKSAKMQSKVVQKNHTRVFNFLLYARF